MPDEPLPPHRAAGTGRAIAPWCGFAAFAALLAFGMAAVVGPVEIFGLGEWTSVRHRPGYDPCAMRQRNLGAAIRNHDAAYGRLPPPAATMAGEAMVSWRVRILPMLDSSALHARYDTTQWWLADGNAVLLSERPPFLACALDPHAASTRSDFVVPTGPGTIWPHPTSGQPVPLASIEAASGNTILLLEHDRRRPHWTQPTDFDDALAAAMGQADRPFISSRHDGGAFALMSDGYLRFLSDDTAPEILKAMLSPTDDVEPETF